MGKAKILITGVTGGVGTELTKILIEQEIPLQAMARLEKDGEDADSTCKCNFLKLFETKI